MSVQGVGRYDILGFEGQRLTNREKRRGARGSRYCLHHFFCISVLKPFFDFIPDGCTEQDHVLDLFLGFCHSLTTLKWINCDIVFIQYLYDFFSTCSISMF